MVNGPRPTQIAAPHRPAAAALAPAAMSPARSPLVLQRQHTSIYSTCSNSTPVLVYGKTATPLAGAWSAEPWVNADVTAPASGSPAGSAATPSSQRDVMPRPSVLSAVLEAPSGPAEETDDVDHDEGMECAHTTNTFDDASSVAETAVYTDAGAKSTVSARSATKTEAPRGMTHVVVKYRFDPYSAVRPRHEMFRCECTECLDAATLGSDRLLSGNYAAHAYDGATPCDAAANAGFDEFASARMYDDGPAVAWHGAAQDQQHHQQQQEPVQPSLAFMPPPPPPKITRGVMAETAEADLDVDAAFYHIATRWYKKVAAVQDHFVPADEQCPEPATDRPFDEWVVAAGKWWLRHFEHLQVKTTPSSGLLRSVPAPAHARGSAAGESRSTSPAPAGFETHASVSASFSNHRTALRTGPRKARGTTGLTAQMLDSLPAPRSAAFSRAQELPW